MSKGKAYTQEQREFIVTLKQSYDQEKLDGETQNIIEREKLTHHQQIEVNRHF